MPFCLQAFNVADILNSVWRSCTLKRLHIKGEDYSHGYQRR